MMMLFPGASEAAAGGGGGEGLERAGDRVAWVENNTYF